MQIRPRKALISFVLHIWVSTPRPRFGQMLPRLDSGRTNSTRRCCPKTSTLSLPICAASRRPVTKSPIPSTRCRCVAIPIPTPTPGSARLCWPDTETADGLRLLRGPQGGRSRGCRRLFAHRTATAVTPATEAAELDETRRDGRAGRTETAAKRPVSGPARSL
jgi:hypothetical protein